MINRSATVTDWLTDTSVSYRLTDWPTVFLAWFSLERGWWQYSTTLTINDSVSPTDSRMNSPPIWPTDRPTEVGVVVASTASKHLLPFHHLQNKHPAELTGVGHTHNYHEEHNDDIKQNNLQSVLVNERCWLHSMTSHHRCLTVILDKKKRKRAVP